MVQFHAYRRVLPHWRIEGATYFVTWRLLAGSSPLDPEERSIVTRTIRFREGQTHRIIGFVVMNDHVHVLVEPKAGWTLERLVHGWKSYTTKCFREQTGRTRAWQREYFDRIIRDEDDLLEKMNYIIKNPWKRWPELENYKWVWVAGMDPAGE
ncbi:MAG: transposase [Myxococcota bacterium]|nr:transposase [Myxococcota bacterium]